MKKEYIIEVKLGDESIGEMSILSDGDLYAIYSEAVDYVETSWQGLRVHPTELKSLRYFLKEATS